MSMSTHVVGFRAADEKWNKMKEVWNACQRADIPIPRGVLDFFDGEDPNDQSGMEVRIENAVEEYIGNMTQGFEVDITKLPKDVRIIRFYNSY